MIASYWCTRKRFCGENYAFGERDVKRCSMVRNFLHKVLYEQIVFKGMVYESHNFILIALAQLGHAIQGFHVPREL